MCRLPARYLRVRPRLQLMRLLSGRDVRSCVWVRDLCGVSPSERGPNGVHLVPGRLLPERLGVCFVSNRNVPWVCWAGWVDVVLAVPGGDIQRPDRAIIASCVSAVPRGNVFRSSSPVVLYALPHRDLQRGGWADVVHLLPFVPKWNLQFALGTNVTCVLPVVPCGFLQPVHGAV
jgi:hypothetical protein